MACEPFSLYLDLEEGKKADLEVIANASLALVSAIKEIAYIIDPSVELTIEIDSGTKGSLSLNTIIRSLKELVAPSGLSIKAVVFTLICFFSADIRQYASTATLDHFFKGEHSEGLSEEQKKEIEAIVKKMIESKGVKEQVGAVYRELERDEAIKGVGATPSAGVRPTNIVPRSQFDQRAGEADVEIIAEEKRTVTKIQPVTLISPVLMPSKRMWKFRANDIEFGARIADTKFQDALLSGKMRIPMKSGIQMIVEMKIDEQKIDGVWMITGRTILRVIKVPKQPLQADLDFSGLSPSKESK